MENTKTRLTLEHNNNKFSAELCWDAGMDELLESFYGLCVAATFDPILIINEMKEFAEIHEKGFTN